MLLPDDTIVAVASAQGPGARGIVRVSGPRLLDCLEPCFRPTADVCLADVPNSQRLAGTILLPGLYQPLDCDLYFWPDVRSYTRQPTAEVHTIGSPPVLAAIVAALCAHGARPAQPGEFTLRAFLAGRLDLTQAEAVLGVIDAADPRSLRVALEQLAGGLAAPLNGLRDALLDLLAHLEAGLDFVDEDIEFITARELDQQLAAAAGVVRDVLDRMTDRTVSDDLVRVVLTGAPNAGKSSLFNALLGNERAIVSEVPGTTRDYLTARFDLDGLVCELVDTAGLDGSHPQNSIDSRAQAATARQRGLAHVELFCVDSTRSLSPSEQAELATPSATNRLIVGTKADCRDQLAGWPADTLTNTITSAATGQGLDDLRARLRQVIEVATLADADVVPSTAARSRWSLQRAHEALAQARQAVQDSLGEELVAAELRSALAALGEVVGAVYTDDVLDRVFSRFCIGK